MKKLIIGIVLVVGLTLGSQAQMPQPSAPRGRVISLSLVEALVAVEAQDLSGIFSFILEEHAPIAMADYLARNPKRLKKFLKKNERDFKKTQGINEWDKKVFLYLVGINAQNQYGKKRISEKLMVRVNEISLLPALPLNIMAQRRGLKS